MTSILFLIETIYCNILRCNYLRKKNLFRNFFFDFLNLNSILNFFKKKMTHWLPMTNILLLLETIQMELPQKKSFS